METFALILFGIWLIGGMIIEHKHSRDTLKTILQFKPKELSFKGWIYLILWTLGLFFIIGLVGLAR
jgi:hypothetical protein